MNTWRGIFEPSENICRSTRRGITRAKVLQHNMNTWRGIFEPLKVSLVRVE